MNQARKLAAEFGISTADQAPLPERAAGPAGTPLRWTLRRRDLFGFLGPVSLSLVATDGPVSVTLWDAGGGVRQRFGHNRGIWPARVEKSSTRNDAATTKWDRNPFFFVGTQKRFWFLTEAERNRVADGIVDLIAERSEREGALDPLQKGFLDLGADLDLDLFEMEMLDTARRAGAVTWDDHGLLAWFDSIAARFDALKAERPDMKWREPVVAKIAQRDLERMKGAK